MLKKTSLFLFMFLLGSTSALGGNYHDYRDIIADPVSTGYYVAQTALCAKVVNVALSEQVSQRFIKAYARHQKQEGMAPETLKKGFADGMEKARVEVIDEKFYGFCDRGAYRLMEVYEYFGLVDPQLRRLGGADFPHPQ